MYDKIQHEYNRLKAGSHTGEFTFLHHEGPMLEYSNNLMERVDYICNNKPESELYDRLRHIYRAPDKMVKIYQKATITYDKIYRRAGITYTETCYKAKTKYDGTSRKASINYHKTCRKAKAAYHETCRKIAIKLIPNCRWNGKTIFGRPARRKIRTIDITHIL